MLCSRFSRTALLICGFLLPLGSLSATQAQPAAAETRKPNVILIMTDDQGYGDLGAHGNRMIRTPNLDRLHAESIRLTDFHVDPTCAPTRAALLTGRYSTRTGVWHTIAGRSLMAHDEVTLAQAFRKGGYRTGIFGKWHLGENYPMRPQDRGFDEVLVHGGGGVAQTPDTWGNDYFDDTYLRNGKPEKAKGYCTDVWFDSALRFIEKSGKRPFLAYIPTNAPHSPYFVDPKYAEPYRKQGVPDPMAQFYGMITHLDENVGRLRQRLRDLGLERDTIIFFMTDNGSAAGMVRGKTTGPGWKGYNAGLRALKGSEYDGGHRVPFFAYWPGGGLTGGRDIDTLAAHVDVVPTLAEICGLKLPDRSLDGRSLLPLLRGEKRAWPERTLFVHSQRVQDPVKWKQSAVMTRRWRLVNGKELYDIQADRGQTRDLAAEHPEVVTQLRGEYEKWWTDLSPAFTRDVSIVLGGKENPVAITAHDWRAADAQVPWNHGMIARQPLSNGWWAVDVRRPGTYTVTLRSWPREAPDAPALDAGTAKLSVGGVEQSRPVPDGARSVTFQVKLPAGPTKLQTWLTRPNGEARGAFYVEVNRK